MRQHCAYSKIKSKVKNGNNNNKNHENERHRQGTQASIPSQLLYHLARWPQSNHCLPWASKALSLKKKKKRNLSYLEVWSSSKMHWLPETHNIKMNCRMWILKMLFRKVFYISHFIMHPKMRNKTPQVSTERTREEGNIWIGDKCRVANATETQGRIGQETNLPKKLFADSKRS